MSLSRKRRRELRKLRSRTEELMGQQRVVLAQAGNVLNEAGRQARSLSDEHLAPRIQKAVDRARPTVDKTVARAQRAADTVRSLSLPLFAGALASTVRTLDRMENREAAQQLQEFGERRGLLAPAKKKRGIGGIIAIALGITAAIGSLYVLWQAFRSDDELWVAPEEIEPVED